MTVLPLQLGHITVIMKPLYQQWCQVHSHVAMHTEQTLVSGRLSVATLDGGTQRLMVLADAYGHSDLISATSISEVSAYSTGQNNILHLAGIRKTG